MSNTKRRDNRGRVLLSGETQEPSGRYKYRYTDALGKRHTTYSWRLTKADVMPAGKKFELSLREKEKEVQKELLRGVSVEDMTVCELVDRYLKTKTGVKHTTKAGYKTVRNILENEPFGHKKIKSIKITLIQLSLNYTTHS